MPKKLVEINLKDAAQKDNIEHRGKIMDKILKLQAIIESSDYPTKDKDMMFLAETAYWMGHDQRILKKEEAEELNAIHKKYKDYIRYRDS